MKRMGQKWLLMLMSLLMACSLLAWPVLAAVGDGTGTSAGEGTSAAGEESTENSSETQQPDGEIEGEAGTEEESVEAVSYTHLTLPTT